MVLAGSQDAISQMAITEEQAMASGKSVRSLALFVALNTIATAALAQAYPSRPIHIVTSTAGGGSDFFTRLLAQVISGPLGEPIVIDNRVPALIGEIVAKAPPDGYTLMYHGSGLMFTPLMRKTAYDVFRDFASISLTAVGPNVLVVHPSLPVRNVRDLINLAKAEPGQLNYSIGVPGTSIHLAAELFKSMAGVNIVTVAYKGTPGAMNALTTGEVQLMFPDPGSIAPYLKSGRLRGLAVTSPQPSPLAPGMPTVASAGLPGYEMVTINALWAPAGTPAPIIRRLNEEIVRALATSDIQEKYFSAGVEAVSSTPDELTTRVRADIDRMATVIRDAGIKAE
jgi:tripartite-type tricarboxylate transporter receptor subunit TctC